MFQHLKLKQIPGVIVFAILGHPVPMTKRQCMEQHAAVIAVQALLETIMQTLLSHIMLLSSYLLNIAQKISRMDFLPCEKFEYLKNFLPEG